MADVSVSVVWTCAVVAVVLVVIKTVIDKVFSLRRAFNSIKDCPGQHLLWTNPFGGVAYLLSSYWPLPGHMGNWEDKFSMYAKTGRTILSSVRLHNSQPYFWVADADALKAVTGDRELFQKDIEVYPILAPFGDNLVTTEYPMYKRHRAVSRPSFNDANNALVWTETFRSLAEWFSEIDDKDAKHEGVTIHIEKATIRVTLLIISAAAFGRHIPWHEDSASDLPSGYKFTFGTAVDSALHDIFMKFLAPYWLHRVSSIIPIPWLSRRLEETRTSYNDLRLHMFDMISSARATILGTKEASLTNGSLLTNLVEANLNQEGDFKTLTDDELLSNIFVFLLAGHETSASALSFTVTYLALYPGCQKKVYEETLRIWPTPPTLYNTDSVYRQDFPKLEYTLAVFRETLRNIPVVPRVSKIVHADTTLKAMCFTPRAQGPIQHDDILQKVDVAIPVGSAIIMDFWAVHTNPLYWGADADEFNPEHFIDTDTYRWPRDAFYGFSAGHRGCIGQQFALAESVCILANIVRRYEILVPLDIAAKPSGKQKELLLQWRIGLTTMPIDGRVRFRRRSL